MLENLIITYKQISICIACLGLIISLLKVVLTYWKGYIKFIRVINWFKFTSYCIIFIILIIVCLIY